MIRILFALCMSAFVALQSGGAWAQQRRHDRPWFDRPQIAPLKGLAFSPDEEAAIRAYFRQHPQAAAPVSGFTRSAIRRAKPLPSSASRAAAPEALTALLAPRPDAQILLVGHDAVILETRREIVIDILRDAL
jgi:hypothetical protein